MKIEMLRSKFIKLFDLVMEQIEDNADEKKKTIENASDNFIVDIKKNNDINKSLDKDDTVKLKTDIIKQTNRTISKQLNEDLNNFLYSRNIDKDLFYTFFIPKYIDDIYNFISFYKHGGNTSLLELTNEMSSVTSTIAEKYKISEEFVRDVMNLNNKKNGVGMGPGELGIAFFFKDTALSKDKGDIIKGNIGYEVKASDGRIPDTQPEAGMIRKNAVKVIDHYVLENKDILKNNTLKPEFLEQKWLYLYVENNYDKFTRHFLIDQFELKNEEQSENKTNEIQSKKLTKKAKKDIDNSKKIVPNSKQILKDILAAIFDQYGSRGKLIIEHLDEIAEDNFNINLTNLKKFTIESLVSYYHDHSFKEEKDGRKTGGFSYFIFYNSQNNTIKIMNWNDFDSMLNKSVFKYPTFGDKEGGQQQKTVLSVK